MKKTMKFIGLIAMAALLFSCEKKNIDTPVENPQETETPSDLSQYDPNEYLVRFGATIESAQTKAEINIESGAVAFETGDKVRAVSGTNSSIYVYDKDAEQFNPESEPLKYSTDDILFYYPADNFDASGVFNMPEAAADLADLGDKAPMAATATAGETASVTFKNVASIFKVSLTGNKSDARKVSSVTLSNSNIPLAAAGSYTVTWNEGNPSIESIATDYSMTVAPAGGIKLDADNAKDFFFILPPTATTMSDMSVTVTMDAEETVYNTSTFSRSRSGDLTIERNKIVSLAFRAGYFYDGDGSATAPYQIKTAEDFKMISKYSQDKNEFLAKSYKQVANLDFNNANLSAYMIGSASDPFTGTYNGDNKTLSSFALSGAPSGNEGIAPFMAINNAVLQNISITDAIVSGGKFSAGLVGYAAGAGVTIQNCSISSSSISDNGHDYGAGGLIGGIYGGTVTRCSGTDLTISTSVTNKQYFGGIICYINGSVTVSECSLNGLTGITNATKFGGIVGQINNSNVIITNCSNHSTIDATTNYMGGICGEATLGTISNCTNDGAINANNSAAGIVAQLGGATVTGCVNTGNISATSNYAGGVVAYFTKGLIEKSRSDATIVATNDNVGGLIGAISGSNGAKANSCFAKGNVKGATNVGGFIGSMQADGAYIVNSLAAANVVATAKENNQAAGGFVGYLKNSTKGKNAWIGNCAVYDVIVKAPYQSSTTNPVRVGGFVGVQNKTTTTSNSKIQNCYYQGVAEHLGYGGSEDFTTSPTTNNGNYIGGIAGYSNSSLLDCYSTPTVRKNGSGGTYTNNTTLTQAFIYGNTNSNPAITTSTSVSLTANTVTLGGVLSAVDATYSSMDFSDWDCYEEDGKYYYYPATLTTLGEYFYKK